MSASELRALQEDMEFAPGIAPEFPMSFGGECRHSLPSILLSTVLQLV